MMNIIFAAVCVYLAYSAVNYSFHSVVYEFNVDQKESKNNPEKIEVSNIDMKALGATMLALNSLETIDKINSIKIKETVNNNIKKSKISYKKIDFTPKKKSIKKSPTAKKKTAFIEIKKRLGFIKNTKIVSKNKYRKDSVKISKIIPKKLNELELSMEEIPEQGSVQIEKIQIVAWSNQAIDFNKLNERVYFAQKEKINNDRISIAASAPERSSSNENSNSMNFPMKSKLNEFKGKNTEVATLGKTKDDELEFFDYSKPSEEIEEVESLNSEVEVIIPKETKREERTVAKVAAEQNKGFDPLAAQSQIITSLRKKQPVTINSTNATLAEAIANIKKSAKKYNAPKVTKTEPKIINGSNEALKRAQDSINTEKSGLQKAVNSLLEPKVKDYGCLDPKDLVIDETYQTKYEITLSGVDYSKRNYSQVRNFELRFHDDHNESQKDYGNGVVNLEFKMNTQLSIRRASLYSRGYYPTTVDLVFEAGDLKANIPVFSLQSFNSILEKEELRGLGAHLLVELDDKTEDVELDRDTKYEAKFYLDKKLQIVSRASYDYQYVLFIGVQAGNTLINFRNSEDKIISKLIHLSSDELYYEPNFYASVKSDEFSFYEENLLSKCKSIMNIDSSKVIPWSYDGKVKKQALNKVQIKNMVYPLGARKYYELSHLEESLFVGRWSQESIIVPSEDYISHVISKFNLDQSDSKCIVQINFSKPIREIVFNGQSGNQNMNMQINVLDKDGKFYDSFSEQSERVFLMGEEQGVISVKIDYTDGSKQFMQSFCSDSTYVVEQL